LPIARALSPSGERIKVRGKEKETREEIKTIIQYLLSKRLINEMLATSNEIQGREET